MRLFWPDRRKCLALLILHLRRVYLELLDHLIQLLLEISLQFLQLGIQICRNVVRICGGILHHARQFVWIWLEVRDASKT